ncbi:MAG: hypothetical protein ABIP79_15065 [Chitinophagaceae bacterium]
MRISFFACLAVLLLGCNSSSTSKKDNTTVQQDVTSQTADSVTNNLQTNELPMIIEPVKIVAADIPPALKFKGKLQDAWQWTDKLGDNIFITSYVAPYEHKDEYGQEIQSSGIYTFHFVKKNSEYTLLWKMNDGVEDCPVDLTSEFMKDAATVTDLDENGVAETKVQYTLACRGDVSPAYMKLIMHEGTAKYVLQGNRWIKDSPESKFDVTADNVNLEMLPGYNKETDEGSQITFGRYENDNDFTNAPRGFLSFASSEWLKYSKEKTGE